MKGKRKKILEGVVVSDKMDKTIVVTVTRRTPHFIYQKGIVKRKRYKVHDKDKCAKLGDRVRIIESRPYSKEKSFELLEVVK